MVKYGKWSKKFQFSNKMEAFGKLVKQKAKYPQKEAHYFLLSHHKFNLKKIKNVNRSRVFQTSQNQKQNST